MKQVLLVEVAKKLKQSNYDFGIFIYSFLSIILKCLLKHEDY